MSQLALFHSLPAAGTPDWVHLVPSGTFRGGDGRGPYSLTDPAQVIAATMASTRIPIDENHATDLAAPQGHAAPARGWIVEMQARADGLWGRVEWTDAGRQLVETKAYRGISPVLTHEAGGRILRVLRASLTNTPNLPLTTLHQRSHTMDDVLVQIRNALGLGPDASGEQILAAIAAKTKKEEVAPELMARLAKAAGADPKTLTSLNALETHLQTAAATRSTSEGELRATVISLQSQIQTMSAAAARDRAVAYVDSAIKAGKPIKPLRDHYIARHAADPAAVELEIGALVSIHSGGIVDPPKDGVAGKTLTAEQKALCSAMGVSEEAYLKTLNA